MVAHRHNRSLVAAAQALGLAALPPLGLAVMWQGFGPWGLAAPSGLALAMACGAALLSFLGGGHYGLSFAAAASRLASWSLGLALVPAFLGWLAVFLPPLLGLNLLLACFLTQALADVVAVEAGLLPPSYGTLALAVNAAATVGLVVTLGLQVI